MFRHASPGRSAVSVVALLTALSSTVALAESPSHWALNMTPGVTEISRSVYDLHMTIFWICVAIGVVVFGVMFYAMLAHRKEFGAEAQQFHEHTSLEIAWSVVPFVILIAMAWPATQVLMQIYDSSESDIDILITGYQWKWKYEYVGEGVSYFSNLSTPANQINNQQPKGEHYLLEVDEPLVLPVNKKVRFLITAHDVIHAWWVPAIAIKKDAVPGFINESWTRIEVPGTYRGQCAELCGKDHGFMPIVVKATTEQEFATWLAGRKAEAAKVRELSSKTYSLQELYSHGEQVYARLCAACHGPAGEGVTGTFPAMKGSKIAQGELRAHMDMVVNGSRKNPAMQAFGPQLSELDIAAVITFERNAFGNNMGDMVQPVDVLTFKKNSL